MHYLVKKMITKHTSLDITTSSLPYLLATQSWRVVPCPSVTTIHVTHSGRSHGLLRLGDRRGQGVEYVGVRHTGRVLK